MLEQKEYILPCVLYTKKFTVYLDTTIPVKACILYFHGGGLLYGSREDLPFGHIAQITEAGYTILSFDYPLAPAAKLETILEDVCTSINDYCINIIKYAGKPLPYFLWGRSAGAYLALLAAASEKLTQIPAGILSYYGYGLLCDNWFSTPSLFYRTLPCIKEDCLQLIPGEIHAEGSLDTHYCVYVYARQTGKWKSLLYEGREKFFLLNYSLRTCKALPCALFCAHSIEDPDVPFAEFTELCSRFSAECFIAPGHIHDFDRETTNSFTKQVLQTSIDFLNRHCGE